MKVVGSHEMQPIDFQTIMNEDDTILLECFQAIQWAVTTLETLMIRKFVIFFTKILQFCFTCFVYATMLEVQDISCKTTDFTKNIKLQLTI